MKSVAFTVKSDSDFYREYFRSKEEKQHFHNLARTFFAEHDLLDNAGYYQSGILSVQLNDEQKSRFAQQLKKGVDKNGVSVFKKNSPMQKLWMENVTSKIDFKVIDSIRFWYFRFIGSGSYNLWDNGNGTIYGYLQDNRKDEIILSDCMTEIKMSEYYAAIEALEAANK